MKPTPDKMTGAVVTIEVEHSFIHDGKSFTAHYEHSVTGLGLEVAIGFVTPALGVSRARPQLVVDAQADDVAILEIREDPTVVVDQGTAYEPLNRDRNNATNSVLYSQETVPVVDQLTTYDDVEANLGDLSGGTILHHETIGQAANPVGFSAGKSRGAREFILAPGLNYVVILTSGTGNATICNLTLNWYEHTDSNYIR